MFLISLPEEVLLTGDKLLLENLYTSMLALGGRLTYNAPYTKKKRLPDAAALTHILTQVHKATGLSLEEIVLQKRAAKWVYARLLLAALASQEGFSVEQIANVLQRSAPRNASLALPTLRSSACPLQHLPYPRCVCPSS